MQAHLKLVGVYIKPWVSISSNNSNDCTGIQCNMVKYLAKSLNFTFDFIDEKEGNGYQLKNGTWTGVLGRFQRKVIN